VDYDIAPEKWHSMSQAQRQQHNALCDQQVFSDRAIDRDDPILVQVVRELGSKRSSNRFAELKIVEIPADVAWQIEEYDGQNGWQKNIEFGVDTLQKLRYTKAWKIKLYIESM
jgi:hypothetical protein